MRSATASGLAAFVLASAALAAGGANVVEDSEVLEPGLCQVDLWVTRFDPGAGYANATPACTLESLPRLQWGAQFQYYWFNEPQVSDQLLGPTLKVNLVPEDKGVGVGVFFSSGVNLRTGDLELATLLVPVTIPVNENGSRADRRAGAGAPSNRGSGGAGVHAQHRRRHRRQQGGRRCRGRARRHLGAAESLRPPRSDPKAVEDAIVDVGERTAVALPGGRGRHRRRGLGGQRAVRGTVLAAPGLAIRTPQCSAQRAHRSCH